MHSAQQTTCITCSPASPVMMTTKGRRREPASSPLSPSVNYPSSLAGPINSFGTGSANGAPAGIETSIAPTDLDVTRVSLEGTIPAVM